MESQNIDNQFKELIESSEDHYKGYSDKAKNYIWHEIQKGKSKSVVFSWKRLAVAATILLLLSLSLRFYHSKKQSDVMVANLKAQVEFLKKQKAIAKQEPASTNSIVTIEKEHIVKVPVVKTEIVERVEYVKDTVYVKQAVVEYREKTVDEVQTDQLVTKADDTMPTTEIILTSSSQKKKKRTFSIENFLNRRHEKSLNVESGSIMVFTAKL
jgi:hypothetical protein